MTNEEKILDMLGKIQGDLLDLRDDVEDIKENLATLPTNLPNVCFEIFNCGLRFRFVVLKYRTMKTESSHIAFLAQTPMSRRNDAYTAIFYFRYL